ncbi:MAG: hypothetical protein IPF92_16530 [Myxococcales bacterium]|nr:hypothetical protein [Myxococcales bacterium]
MHTRRWLAGGLGLVTMAAAISCSSSTPPAEIPLDVLGGDTNVPAAQVGNVVSLGAVKVGADSVDVNARMTITKNEGGLVTARVTADPTKDPRIAKFAALIPASAKKADGTIDTEVKFRVTTEGVQDFFNKDGKPHTVVKYAGNVGDTYKVSKSDGVVITRTVVAKSDKDDFPYGFFSIKTMTIEQDSRIPGIKKIVIRANHKFGIVHVEAVADDGSTMSSYVLSKN